MTLIAVIIFVLLVLLSLPISIGSGVGVAISYEFFSELPQPGLMLIQRMFMGVGSFTLLAVPLFLLCGRLMNVSGMTNRIFNFARTLVGHIPGGLAHANVLASMIFAGMSGSSVADAGGLGQVEIKAMKDQGYRLDSAVAVTAASATIGPIIPPSISMIIYAFIAEESIGRLFLGGFIPGILMALSLMVIIYIIAISKKGGYPTTTEKPSLKKIWDAFKKGSLSLMTPVIILGGIIGGIFTVTEAAAVAVLYAYILGGLIYKQIKLSQLPRIILESMKTTAIMMFILATISGLSWILVYEKITDSITQAILSISNNPWIILTLINIFLLLFGCILEAIPIMILTIPILLPIIKSVGISPVHFGVLMAVNLSIGTITPPIGMILFVLADVSGLILEKIMKAIIPFILPLIIILFLITYIPMLVMVIPNWIMP